MKPLPLLMALILTTACSYLPIDTLRQLNQLDPMTADPASIAVRFQVPQGLDIPEGSVKLTLAVKHTDGEELLEVYLLERIALGGDITFRIAPGDLERLRAQQTTVQQWGEDDSEGQMTVGIENVCTLGAGPQADATISNMISVDGGETYLPLAMDVPLSDVLEQGEFDEMSAC